MSEIEKAWIDRRTVQLQREGLARAAAKMIAIHELLALQRRASALPTPTNTSPEGPWA